MAKVGDKLTVGGKEFLVNAFMGGPDSALVEVMEKRGGDDYLLIKIPAEILDAAFKADILRRELERRTQQSHDDAKAAKERVKEGDTLAVGGVEFKVEIVSKSRRPPYLIHVVDTGLERHYLFSMPVAMWEAAVRGAWCPTDDELGALKEKYDELRRRVDPCHPEPVSKQYVEALEARVRELTTTLVGRVEATIEELREENRRWQTADSKAVAALKSEIDFLTYTLGQVNGAAQRLLGQEMLGEVRGPLMLIEEMSELDEDERAACEQVEAIDFEAAKNAVAGIRSKLKSMAFAAPEMVDTHVQELEEHMAALGKALGQSTTGKDDDDETGR